MGEPGSFGLQIVTSVLFGFVKNVTYVTLNKYFTDTSKWYVLTLHIDKTKIIVIYNVLQNNVVLYFIYLIFQRF